MHLSVTNYDRWVQLGLVGSGVSGSSSLSVVVWSFLWGRGLVLLNGTHRWFLLAGVCGLVAVEYFTDMFSCPHRSFVLTGVRSHLALDPHTRPLHCSRQLFMLTSVCSQIALEYRTGIFGCTCQ